MKEQEVIARQQSEAGSRFYLVHIGMFFQAFGDGAFALHRAMGYAVRRLHRKTGDVFMAGFPAKKIEEVCQELRNKGAGVEKLNDRLWSFNGIDGTPDPSVVAEPRRKAKPAPVTVKPAPAEAVKPGAAVADHPPGKSAYDWLAEAVKGFNLSATTPIDAVCFIRDMQQRLSQSPVKFSCR